MLIIRLGYCKPNPGWKTKLHCRWYTDKDGAIKAYRGGSIWVKKNNNKYRAISYEELLKL